MRPIISIRRAGAPPTPGLGSGAAPLVVASLRFRRSLLWPAGQGEILVPSGLDTPGPGESLQVTGASDGNQERPLFTGRVLRSRAGPAGTRLLIEEATGPLARLHLDKSVTRSTVSKVVEELCREAKVEVSAEPPGATLQAYALQFRPSGMDHILRLAQLSGMLVRTDAEGKLRVETAALKPAATIGPSDGVISYEAAAQTGRSAEVRVTGDGALGSKGAGAEAWLLQSLDAVAAGAGAESRHLPALKAAADVNRAATAMAAHLKESSTTHRLVLAGIPPVDLGEVILLTGFGSSPEPARLAGITLQWDAPSGLVSYLELHGIGV